jgi:hypothetical protein
MSDDNDNEVELSPGFFDLNNPNNDDDIDEISKLVPDKINVENANSNNTKNFVIEFFTLLVFNATNANKPCGCDGGWSRTSTY